MKIPTSLKIGGHKVSVKIVEMDENDGEWSTTKNEIRICRKLAQSQKESTFLHELLHALNSEFNATYDKHMICESLAQQLYQVLSDNKMLR